MGTIITVNLDHAPTEQATRFDPPDLQKTLASMRYVHSGELPKRALPGYYSGTGEDILAEAQRASLLR